MIVLIEASADVAMESRDAEHEITGLEALVDDENETPRAGGIDVESTEEVSRATDGHHVVEQAAYDPLIFLRVPSSVENGDNNHLLEPSQSKKFFFILFIWFGFRFNRFWKFKNIKRSQKNFGNFYPKICN